MRTCGVITQAVFAYDVERFVIETVLRRGSFDSAIIIIPYRGSLRTFASYRDFVCSKHRVLTVAVADAPLGEYYGISVVGAASLRVSVLWFKDGTKMEPIITRRSVAGLCLPWFDDVSDN